MRDVETVSKLHFICKVQLPDKRSDQGPVKDYQQSQQGLYLWTSNYVVNFSLLSLGSFDLHANPQSPRFEPLVVVVAAPLHDLGILSFLVCLTLALLHQFQHTENAPHLQQSERRNSTIY